MPDQPPVIVWVRKDLRLGDHAALNAARSMGGAVIPVFICDDGLQQMGAAARFRFGLGIGHFKKALQGIGSDLILRKGEALDVLKALIAETGAKTVFWQRGYDPRTTARDTKIKAGLKDAGIEAKSFAGHLLFEPWSVKTKTGDFYKVYTPFWKSVRGQFVERPIDPIKKLTPPEVWPKSETLSSWNLDKDMRRGAHVLVKYQGVGETAALARLDDFAREKIARYKELRDYPGLPATSGLSENLAYGEISPRTIWHKGCHAMAEVGQGAETFLKELVWREFAYHLIYHTPHIETQAWRPEWQAFTWNEDQTNPQFLRWCQGRTGIEFVDAAMREMYVTGTMHNRARMIVASYLTKHLMVHWKLGMDWFAEHLTDWDPASNAMGWQWAAGSGPDAAPYFRVFNPVTQLDKFDADRRYARRWIAEGQGTPPQTALDFFDACPKTWALDPSQPYPRPVVTAEAGRTRALDAYKFWRENRA